MSDNHGAVPFSQELTGEQARAALVRSQLALQESEARYRALFDTMLEGFAYCQMLYDEENRPADWVYLEVNAAFAALTGLTDVVGKRVTEVIPGIKEQSPQLFEIYHRVASTGRPERFEFDFTPLPKWLDISVTSPNPGYFVAVFEDITERKQAKEALGRSEAMYRTLIEQAPEAVFILGSEGQFLLANPCFCSMLGYTQEELLQTDVLDTYLPEDLVQGSHRMAQLRAGETLHFDRRMRRKDGGAVLVEARAMRLPDGRIQAFVRDITQRKQAEEAVRDAETRYRLLFEHSPDGVVIIDPTTARPLEFNRTAHEQLGYSREEFAHLSSADLEAMETPEETESRIAQVTQGGRADFDTKHRTKQGETRDVHVTAQYTDIMGRPAYHCIWRDVTEQKQAVEALQESEERYRRLFELESDAIVLVDSESGRVMEVNTAMTTLYGYSREEWLSMKHTDVSVEAEKTRRAALEGETQIPVRWHRKKDGTIFPVEITASHFELAGRSVHVAAIRDISAREQTQQALRDSEARSRSYFELPLIGLAITSPETKAWLEVNDSLCAMLGYSALELSGLSWADMTHLDDLEADLVEFNSLLADESDCYSLEKRFIRKSGEPIWTNLSVGCVRRPDRSVDYTVCLLQDITERKRAEEALKESEEKFRSMAEQSTDLISLTDAAGVILYASPASERLFGVAPEKMAGCHFASFLDESAIPAANAAFLTLTESGQSVMGLELLMKRKDGSTLVGEVSGVRHYIASQPGTLVTIRDITERLRLQEQLQQSQKMESIGRLAGGVAHDFNNMLGVILGYTELALEEVDPEAPLRSDLEQIQSAALRSADLTRQLLAFARKQTVTPRVLDLNDAVGGTLKMLHRLIGEDIELAWLPGAQLWPVRMDPTQIDQLLANLCLNARDAITGVGRIAIETHNSTVDDAFCALNVGVAPGDYVSLLVSDDGSGMTAETLDHLFEPFFTTKEVGQGTGLGLATVYGIVKQNEGFISVQSELDRGTSVRIYLPRHVGKAERLQAEGPAQAADRGHETVLLVEDEPAILNVSKRMLEGMGYRVLAAGTPGEAISLAEKHAGEVHLLLTDVVMPEMNGRDLAKRLLSLYPDLKRLFMSGYAADAIAHEGVIDEGVHFLQKPFSMNDFAAKVREVLDEG